ncbi:MAG: hypothetical protein IPO00_07470 [Betaproteobacteria bacterium]|nr:hypothetical protein [Betaproteobacteria bacterium]
MLLQTYARDTGEILSEMNMPIVVEGRVWGNIRIGIDSQVLLEALIEFEPVVKTGAVPGFLTAGLKPRRRLRRHKDIHQA